MPASEAGRREAKMGIPAPSELVLILLVLTLMFGAKKIPEVMGGIAEGIKIFKKTMESDDSPTPAQLAQPPSPPSIEGAKDQSSPEEKTESK